MVLFSRKKRRGDEEVFHEIHDKLKDYRTIASDYGVEVNTTSLHITHGILYCTFDFKHIEQRNLNELLGFEEDYVIGSYEEFYTRVYENMLDVRELKETFHEFTTRFFKGEISEFRIKNILYKKHNELLYLDISFSTLLEDSFVIFIDDVTDYVNDKLLLEEFACHNNILVKEVHHRVKNNLQILLSLMSIQQRFRCSNEIISEYMKLSISSMAIIHNQLHDEDLSSVPLKSLINDYATNIQNFYGNLDIDFVFSTEGDVFLTIDQSNPLFLILNELIINSINHAFDENNNKKLISCNFKKVDRCLSIVYCDNGNGLHEIDEQKTGLGHVLVDSLISQVDGEYDISSVNGYHMDIRMPILEVQGGM